MSQRRDRRSPPRGRRHHRDEAAEPAADRPRTDPSPDRLREVVPRLGSFVLALVALAVYLVQCPSVTGDKDSPEFTIVLALNGVAHPTGYPLYTILGHFFAQMVHAFGATWAYASNAWSAVGGALAVYFLHRLALALTPGAAPGAAPAFTTSWRGRFLLALLPVAFFAFNPIWTYETTLAEVYSWHVAWVLGAALYFVRLVRGLSAPGDWPQRRLYQHAVAWGLLCGVGGAHHATSILVAAPLSIVILVVLIARRRMRAGLLPALIVAACAPLLAYGFIFWRATHPTPIDWIELAPGFGGLLDHVTGQQFAALLGHWNPSPEQAGFLRRYVFPFLFPGLLLAFASAVRARDPGERALLWGLVVSALAGTAYAFAYGAVDPASYFLYPTALALAAMLPFVARLVGVIGAARRTRVAATGLLALATLLLWVPWLITDQRRTSGFTAFDHYVHSMWQAIPMDSAIVFWSTDLYYKLLEYQLLEGEKPGVVVAHPRALYTPGGRARFFARTSIDPLADPAVAVYDSLPAYSPDSLVRRSIDAVESSVNRRTSLPVIHFDPEQGSVRLLLKAHPDSIVLPVARDRSRR
jgi:hypothetical protein